MTQVQVDYQKAQETRRHNLRMEQIGAIEASTGQRQAAVKEREVAISETLVPYTKWEKGTTAAKNIGTVQKDIAQGVGAVIGAVAALMAL